MLYKEIQVSGQSEVPLFLQIPALITHCTIGTLYKPADISLRYVDRRNVLST